MTMYKCCACGFEGENYGDHSCTAELQKEIRKLNYYAGRDKENINILIKKNETLRLEVKRLKQAFYLLNINTQ